MGATGLRGPDPLGVCREEKGGEAPAGTIPLPVGSTDWGPRRWGLDVAPRPPAGAPCARTASAAPPPAPLGRAPAPLPRAPFCFWRPSPPPTLSTRALHQLCRQQRRHRSPAPGALLRTQIPTPPRPVVLPNTAHNSLRFSWRTHLGAGGVSGGTLAAPPVPPARHPPGAVAAEAAPPAAQYVLYVREFASPLSAHTTTRPISEPRLTELQCAECYN